jgi:uncharacterized membrane protein YidH (DUF202 family)
MFSVRLPPLLLPHRTHTHTHPTRLPFLPPLTPRTPQAHPSDHYHLRLHRARSVTLTPNELVEVRAAQRTFEGAYVRTAISQFSFALVVLKIFTAEFYSIGALFAVYGAGVLAVSLWRRHEGNKAVFCEVAEDGVRRGRFKSSGNVVVVLTGLSIVAYGCLLLLVMRLSD